MTTLQKLLSKTNIKHSYITKNIRVFSTPFPINNIEQTDNCKTNKKYEKYLFPHHHWQQNELNIKITHIKPITLSDKLAYLTVRTMRFNWDLFSGYTFGKKLNWFSWNERMYLRRIIFLESVAGVPGYVFGMLRHLKSLRKMQRDRGWINSLLSEAENERIHLLVAMQMYNPGNLFRFGVIMAQGILANFLFISYVFNPRYCHRLVGYIEEEAVKTYTGLLEDIDNGKLPEFNKDASCLAKNYWGLKPNATWRDVFAHIRADESHHRDVNHDLAPISNKDNTVNPHRFDTSKDKQDNDQ